MTVFELSILAQPQVAEKVELAEEASASLQEQAKRKTNIHRAVTGVPCDFRSRDVLPSLSALARVALMWHVVEAFPQGPRGGERAVASGR